VRASPGHSDWSQAADGPRRPGMKCPLQSLLKGALLWNRTFSKRRDLSAIASSLLQVRRLTSEVHDPADCGGDRHQPSYQPTHGEGPLLRHPQALQLGIKYVQRLVPCWRARIQFTWHKTRLNIYMRSCKVGIAIFAGEKQPLKETLPLSYVASDAEL